MIKTIEELDRVRDECRTLVTKRSLMSGGVAVMPVPGVDVAADVALLAQMIPEINRRFGLSAEQVAQLDPQVARQTFVIATSLGNSFIGKAVTKNAVIAVLKKIGIRVASKSITKYIPLIGSAVAATISFAAMKMVGTSHIDDCYETVKRTLSESPEASA